MKVVDMDFVFRKSKPQPPNSRFYNEGKKFKFRPELEMYFSSQRPRVLECMGHARRPEKTLIKSTTKHDLSRWAGRWFLLRGLRAGAR